MKKTTLKKLTFKKLTISKLTNSDTIQGGSGICDADGTASVPVQNCPLSCNRFLSGCKSCIDHNHSGETC